jgi:hypothetical protein
MKFQKQKNLKTLLSIMIILGKHKRRRLIKAASHWYFSVFSFFISFYVFLCSSNKVFKCEKASEWYLFLSYFQSVNKQVFLIGNKF